VDKLELAVIRSEMADYKRTLERIARHDAGPMAAQQALDRWAKS
jgi:hypothetical protein